MATVLSERTMSVNENYVNDEKTLNRATDRCEGQGILVLDSSGEDWKPGGSCGAQAHVKVATVKGLDLLFCGHHYRKYETELWNQGFGIVVDTRDSLIQNKLIGSEN